jgi:hypothetical protein
MIFSSMELILVGLSPGVGSGISGLISSLV